MPCLALDIAPPRKVRKAIIPLAQRVVTLTSSGNVSAASVLGEALALEAIKKGIKKVAFDRAGFAYHGRVKALADAAREAGLQF